MVSKVLVRASESAVLERLAASNPLVRRIALRFVAGEALDDGIRAARELVASGRTVSLDLVGEHVRDLAAARTAADAYSETLTAIEREGLPGGISVKPSQLAAGLDEATSLDLVVEVAKEAGRLGAHVTLDMEDRSTTDATIAMVETLQAAGHHHVGCAIQTYLHRTPDDLARLSRIGASVRLCKGAYAEPPSVAFQRRRDVDDAYRRCATMLLEDGTYPRFATHDHRLIGYVRREARRLGRRPGDDYEFQMLYGVRTDVQRRLVELGERVCVYVPFGDAWYAYFMRRLAERPANLLFLLRAVWS
jgi:proline dehydrogenase